LWVDLLRKIPRTDIYKMKRNRINGEKNISNRPLQGKENADTITKSLAKKRGRDSSLPQPTEITYAYYILSDIVHSYIQGEEYQHFHLGDNGRSSSFKKSSKKAKILEAFSTETNARSTPQTYLSHGETQYLYSFLHSLNRHVQKVDQDILEIDQLRKEEKQSNRETRKLRKQLLHLTLENRATEQNECVELQKEFQDQETRFEKDREAINFLKGVNKMFEKTGSKQK